MKSLLRTLLVFSLALISPAIAGQDEYDDCILEYLKGAKLDLSTHLIRQACEQNYKSSAFTSKKKFAYNACLLDHLVGIESITAVMEIKAACGRKYK